jgi:hypothetical protein
VLCHEGESRSLIYIEFIMDSNEYHSHIVRFASPVFTIVDISNPSWSSEQSIGMELLFRAMFFIIDCCACLDSMEHSGWAAARGSRDESGEKTRSDPLLASIEPYTHPYLFYPVEPLDFGLGSLPSYQDSEHFLIDVEGSGRLCIVTFQASHSSSSAF